MEMAGEDMNARVRLENGDYVAVLAVYHQLHCLVSELSHRDCTSSRIQTLRNH